MSRVATIRSFGFLVALLAAAASLAAQRPKRGAPPATPAAPRADSARVTPAGDPALRALHWRLVGPFRGGRAVAGAGHPTRPPVFYFRAGGGGGGKTTGGRGTWGKAR